MLDFIKVVTIPKRIGIYPVKQMAGDAVIFDKSVAKSSNDPPHQKKKTSYTYPVKDMAVNAGLFKLY